MRSVLPQCIFLVAGTQEALNTSRARQLWKAESRNFLRMQNKSSLIWERLEKTECNCYHQNVYVRMFTELL